MQDRAIEQDGTIELKNARSRAVVRGSTVELGGHVVQILPDGPSRQIINDPEEGEPAAALIAVHNEHMLYQACVSVPLDAEVPLLELRFFNRSVSDVSFTLQVDSELHDIALAPRDTVAFQSVLPRSVTFGDVARETVSKVAAPESQPIAKRGGSYLRLAFDAARAQDFRAALDYIDRALATLGDDPLTWWYRAAVARHLGDDNDTELTTAHALSPLEPVLRAEAFLAVPQTMGKEPTTILRPLVENPHDLYEAIHVLTTHGLVQDAARVIDEALRHSDVALLRYLYAWNLYKSTRMQVEAAGEVARAARLPMQPPFAQRSTETEAIAGLVQAFPKDERLAELLKQSGPA
jgi:hypothetical protein